MAEALLISRNDLVKFTALNGNIDTDKFIQFIKIAQDIHIQNYLGTDLLNKLKNDIVNSQSGIGEVTTATINIAGSGYTTALNVPAIGGTGSGLTFDIVAVLGIVISATINNNGLGYVVGDLVTITGGNTDCDIDIDGIDEIQEPYLSLLTTYVKPMLIHWAMVEFIPWSAYTLANKGVYKHNSENAVNVEKNEVDFLVEKERMIAQNYTERFINFISYNNVLFPEYTSNSNSDMFPSTQNNFTGWYI
jgi:hypothetical protein